MKAWLEDGLQLESKCYGALGEGVWGMDVVLIHR